MQKTTYFITNNTFLLKNIIYICMNKGYNTPL